VEPVGASDDFSSTPDRILAIAKAPPFDGEKQTVAAMLAVFVIAQLVLK
jgi:hypothetical protein